MLEGFEKKEIIEPLLAWFGANARRLPWRQEPTPYRVWVSEIMLQQTRVEAVKPYFRNFMEALPDIEALAACPEDILLKLWEGLGYYNRVRNMQKAAQAVMQEYGGQLPADYEALLSLPGIGHYTAGAIASIAYGIPVPAVDGNVLRVITRLCGDESDIMKQSVRNSLEKELLEFMPKDRAGAFNQALMELGAMVCVPNGAPLCAGCPWGSACRAKEEGSWNRIPVKTRAKARRIEDKTVFVIRIGDRVVLNQRPGKGLLAGLYEFPNTEGHLDEGQALCWVREHGIAPLRIQLLEDAKHIFSHVEWHMRGYMIQADELEHTEESLLFVEVEATRERYPIPAAFAAYTRYMNIQLGAERMRLEGEEKGG